MKKVLHIAAYYPPSIGGIEQVAFDVVHALAGEYEQIVLCFNHEKGNAETIEDGVRVIRVKAQLKVSSQSIAFGFKKTLKKLLYSFQPDFIHFHFPNPYITHCLLKQKFTARLFVHYHSDIVKQKILGKFFVGQTKRLLRRVDKIIATSPNYIEGSPYLRLYRDNCTVIPNAVNERRLTVASAAEAICGEIRNAYRDKIICLFVGRHVPYKGLKYLIQAVELSNKNIVFLIAGTGKLTDSLKKQAKGNPNIRFIGKLNPEQLTGHYLACDIFTFPSITRNEAFGLALAEAMWFSKPTVTFTIPGSGVNYVSLNGVTGIECPNGDSAALADAVNKLAVDSVLRAELGANARNRTEGNFLFNGFKENIKDLYHGGKRDENSD
ncbi:MAG: glycosyltransferase [Clostridiales bacterium]|jgi:glycosyltransferase involved in cell wall biosynthesis|nr:glycosyltransferase [Clostridiales bacterium]